MSEKYLLLDLERTIRSGTVFYWKPHGRGYTPDVTEAGRYLYEEASEAAQDHDNRTLAFSEKFINDILKK